ncbi:MAG: hypothetical protein RR273_02685 [Oscillospiraceae bacterium]
MAQRRMFSKEVIESDEFLYMSHSAQLLYFYLGLKADDEGFIAGANAIIRMGSFEEKNLQELTDNGMIIKLSDGIYVITHWHMNNYIRMDRYTPTTHTSYANMLKKDTNGMYYLPFGIPVVDQMPTQVREGKSRKGEKREDEVFMRGVKTHKKPYGIKNNIFLTNEELQNIKSRIRDYQKYINTLSVSQDLVRDEVQSHYQQLLVLIGLEEYGHQRAKPARKEDNLWTKELPPVPQRLSEIWPSKI